MLKTILATLVVATAIVAAAFPVGIPKPMAAHNAVKAKAKATVTAPAKSMKANCTTCNKPSCPLSSMDCGTCPLTSCGH
jgi:hypothetical protein